MKPSLRKVSIDPLSSFSVRNDDEEKLINNWHYHPELELLLIENSTGTSIIGDKIESFNSDYLVLIGANLPHTFIHDNYCGKKKNPAKAIVIHFDDDFLGNDFLNLPELKEVKKIFALAKFGIKINDESIKNIKPILNKIHSTSHLERILYLLEIFKILAIQKNYSLITSNGYTYYGSKENENRINKVHDFTIKNFKKDITIEQVAHLLNLTKESFCRFFKKTTRKSYFQFLIEFRIGHACRMLVEDDCTIKEIGHQCGYDNLSNFYHQFKKVMGKSPLQYQKDYFGLAKKATEGKFIYPLKALG